MQRSGLMSSIALRFRGWKGVVFLVGFVVLLWLRYGRAWELPPRARETIMLRLLADQSSQVFTANEGVPRTKLKPSSNC